MYLCIIPARAGSKRIKNKNIKKFLGFPIIKYSIEAAKNSKLFKRVFVSTNSKKIKKIALQYGASVPFLRSKNISDDFTPLKKVLISTLKKIDNLPKYFCLIYATAPLIDKKDLQKSLSILKKNTTHAESILSVSKYSKPIQRALKKNKKNYLDFINKKYSSKRSQDLEDTYFDAALFCWFNTERYLKKKGQNLKTLPYLIQDSKTHDIDEKKDWKIVKQKFLNLRKKNQRNF
tara:strand:- start:67 stop:765 length:699 start_codon:yes stop_codon:yes gene_type:complete